MGVRDRACARVLAHATLLPKCSVARVAVLQHAALCALARAHRVAASQHHGGIAREVLLAAEDVLVDPCPESGGVRRRNGLRRVRLRTAAVADE
jgi:hypothetical protein